MTNKRQMWSATLIAVFTAFLASRVALAADEAEPDDPYTSAQALTIGSDGTVTVTNASIYNTTAHRDVDFYSFHGNAGDVVTFNIDGGMNASFVGIYTSLGVWGPDYATNPVPLVTQTGSLTTDAGSPTTADARIDNFPLPATGTYIVGVSTDPGEFVDINTLQTGGLSAAGWSPDYGVTGSYTLIISGVTPYSAPAPVAAAPATTALPINIDIMPGRHNVIWLRTASASASTPDQDSERKRDLDRDMHRHFRDGIPVALLSSSTFTPSDVNQSSLRFGSAGDEDSLIRCNRRQVDLNHDGIPDLICHFDATKANFQPGDTNGIVTGETATGEFEGQGYLKVVTGRRHHHHDFDRGHDRGRHHRR